MDAEVKAKWVEALRSGAYRQGGGNLRTKGKAGRPEYCCLGVLCEVLGLNYDPNWYFPFGNSAHEKRYGLTHDTQETLANMNDGCAEWTGKEQSFKQIANYIEKNL